MKTVIRTFMGAVAIAALAGCGPLAGVLTNPPTIPGASTPVAPGAVASTAPGATTPTTPAATTAPSATTAPTGGDAGGDAGDTAADCKLSSPAAPPEKGTAKLGAFNNQNLPNGYVAAYDSEQEVYDAIGKLDVDNWACFQKFYPGASGLYKKYRGWE